MAAKKGAKLKTHAKVSSKLRSATSSSVNIYKKEASKKAVASTKPTVKNIRKFPSKASKETKSVARNSIKSQSGNETSLLENITASKQIEPESFSKAPTSEKIGKCKKFTCKQCKMEFPSIGLLRKHQYICKEHKNNKITPKKGIKTSNGKADKTEVSSVSSLPETKNTKNSDKNSKQISNSVSARKLRTKGNDSIIIKPNEKSKRGRKRQADEKDVIESSSREGNDDVSPVPIVKKRGRPSKIEKKVSINEKRDHEIITLDDKNKDNDSSAVVLQSSMFNKVKNLLSNSKTQEKTIQLGEGSSAKTMQISTLNMRKNLAFSMERNAPEPIAKKSLPVPTNKKANVGRPKKSKNTTPDVIIEEASTSGQNGKSSAKEVEVVFDNHKIPNGVLASNVKKEKDVIEIVEEPADKDQNRQPEVNAIVPDVITVLDVRNADKRAGEDPTILPDNIEPEILTPLQPVKEENDKIDYLNMYDDSNGEAYSQDSDHCVDSPDKISESTSSKKTSTKEGFAFTCAVCQKNFSRKYHLDRHLRISKCSGLPMPTFPCELCNRVYTRKDNLREHLRSHTGEVHRRKNHKCPYCDKAFHGQSLLAIHVRKHTGEKPYACDYCPKKFPSTGALSKHRMTHTGEKPYSCNECGRRFTLKGTLSRHLRTHTGIRPHTCTFCGKKFIQVGGLNAHMFFHTGENGFKCEDCGKIFNRKARLQMHQLYVHIKLKPFVCDHCQKSFTRKEDLMRHTVLHTGEKPYKCPTCDRRFSVKPSLKLHLLTHTKEEPRSCHECGRAFIRKDCLLRHMRKRHRDVFDKLLFDEKDVKDTNIVNTRTLSEKDLTENIRELLFLLIDEPTLIGFGWPDKPVDEVLELVIQRCGHTPVSRDHYIYMDRLRENAKLLFTVVIDDNAVKTLLNNQTVDEVILHVLRLAKT